MNQLQLNKIALHFIENQSAEVASKIRSVLHEDTKKRPEQIAGPALHYIHNISEIYQWSVKNTCNVIMGGHSLNWQKGPVYS